MADSQIFEPDGRAIPFDVEGDGPAVVLIAGRGLNIAYLVALAHSVAQEDFRVVRVGSRRPPRDAATHVAMHDLAQDAVDVMDHLGIAEAWVGGHAFGGSVARIVSVDHADRVRGVLLLGVEGAAPATSDSVASESVRDAAVEQMQRAAREEGDLPPLAPDVPVLVIQGADDVITPPSNGDELQASAPDRVSVVLVDGGGHMFPATHVGATSWAIEDYLDWD